MFVLFPVGGNSWPHNHKERETIGEYAVSGALLPGQRRKRRERGDRYVMFSYHHPAVRFRDSDARVLSCLSCLFVLLQIAYRMEIPMTTTTMALGDLVNSQAVGCIPASTRRPVSSPECDDEILSLALWLWNVINAKN